MRQPARRAQRELFDEVFADPVRAAQAYGYRLDINGTPYATSELRSFSGEGGAAWAAEGATLAQVPPEAERKPVRITSYIEGVPYPAYEGRLLTTTTAQDDDGTTTHRFGASTPGYWQNGDDAVRFGRRTVYPEQAPSSAARDMLNRLPYARVILPDVRTPGFFKAAGEPYQTEQAIGDGLAEIEEKSGLQIRDNALGWAIGRVRPSLGDPVDPVASWRHGEHLISFSADLNNPQRYRDVMVLRQLEDGTYEPMLTDANGEPAPVAVRYPRGVEPPPAGTTYYEILPGATEAAHEEAQSRAQFLARQIAYGEYAISMTTVFLDPRIEDFDIVEAASVDHDTGELRRFRVLIEAVEQDHVTGTATYTGRGWLTERSMPRTLRPVPGLRSSGVRLRPYGTLASGTGYVTTQAPWWHYAGDGTIQMDAGAPVSQNEQGEWVFTI